MKKLFLSTLLLALPLLASAYSCKVDGIYYNLNSEEKTAEVTSGDNKYTGDAVIPEKFTYEGVEYSVTSIGDDAFWKCSGLTSLTIPNSVTRLGSGAFGGCSTLTSVTIPNSVTSIGDWAFQGCSSLTSVTIPNSVTTIREYAFFGCSGLTSVTIPNSVRKIGDWAFAQSSGLTSLTIGNSVTSIGNCAFFYCSGLTSVDIGNSVTSIGDQAFDGCSSLTSIHIKDLAAWCKIAFNSSSSNPLYYAHHLYLNGKEIKDLVISNSVTNIGNYALYGCSGLTSVTIPNSVTSIGYNAFSGCVGLTTVISEVEIPFFIDVNCFSEDVFKNSTLYVPKGTVDKYKSTDYWNKFVFIEESDPTDIIQVSSDDLLISTQNGIITVRGEQNGLPLTVYSADGKMLGSATMKDGQASISTNLQRGEIAIVKVGSKSVKIKM